MNEDVSDVVERIAARATVTGVARALDAVSSAEARIARNVTPQLAIEVMLFDIREGTAMPVVVPCQIRVRRARAVVHPRDLDILAGDHAICTTERGT
ncbi:MAG: hypothetical protein ACLTSX_09590 [Collinsella sp.]